MRPTSECACLSELELDRLLAGDSDPGLKQRLEGCEHCRERLASALAQRQAWMPPEHVDQQVSAIAARLTSPPARRRRQSWAIGIPLGVAAAAALLLVAWPRGRAAAPIGDRVRIRGGIGFDVVLAAPGPSRMLAEGEAVPAGATLSFRARCVQGCSVALFAVGASGIEALAAEAPPPWSIDAADPALLPVSVTVGGESGDDLVVAFLCSAPPDLGALGSAATAAYGAPPDLAAPAPSIAGCETRTHRIRKSGAAR